MGNIQRIPKRYKLTWYYNLERHIPFKKSRMPSINFESFEQFSDKPSTFTHLKISINEKKNM